MSEGKVDVSDVARADDGVVTVPLAIEPMEARPRPPSAAPPRLADAVRKLWTRALPPPVPTGIGPLDHLIGGLRPESMYILDGPPGRGKTGLALQIARAMARTRPVVYLGSELSCRQAAARIVAQEHPRRKDGQINRWLDIYEMGPQSAEGIARSVAHVNIRPYEIESPDEIDEVLEAVADEEGVPPVIVLDYLQDLANRADVEDPRRAVSLVSATIRKWAKHAASTALVVSSVPRAHYGSPNAEKKASDYVGASKESGGIEYDGAAVMFLEVEDCPPNGTCAARLHVAKHRFGANGTVDLVFNGAVGMFEADDGRHLRGPESKALELITKHPGTMKKTDVAAKIGGKKQTAMYAVDELLHRRLVRANVNGHLEPAHDY